MPPEQIIKPTVPIPPNTAPEQKPLTTTPEKPLPIVAVPVAAQVAQSAEPKAPIITPDGAAAAPVIPRPMAEIVDPAKTLGTVGLVLAVLIPPAGTAISGFAFYKSNKLGYSNYRALAGIIVGAFMSIMMLMFLSVI